VRSPGLKAGLSTIALVPHFGMPRTSSATNLDRSALVIVLTDVGASEYRRADPLTGRGCRRAAVGLSYRWLDSHGVVLGRPASGAASRISPATMMFIRSKDLPNVFPSCISSGRGGRHLTVARISIADRSPDLYVGEQLFSIFASIKSTSSSVLGARTAREMAPDIGNRFEPPHSACLATSHGLPRRGSTDRSGPA